VSEENVTTSAKKCPVLIDDTVSDECNVIVFAVIVLPVIEENVSASIDKTPVLIDDTVSDECNSMVFAVMVLAIREENVTAFTLMELHVIVDAVSILRFALFDHCAAPFVLIVNK
jgi:hypothetical protein